MRVELAVLLLVVASGLFIMTYSVAVQRSSLAVSPVVQEPTDTIAIKGLNLNDRIGSDFPAMSDNLFHSLARSQILTVEGATRYTQSIRLRVPGQFNGGQLQSTRDDFGNTGDFMVFDDVVFEYEILFDEGLVSSFVDRFPQIALPAGSTVPVDTRKTLKDLIDRPLNIMGKEYTITDAEYDTGTNSLRLTLVGESGTIVWYDSNITDANATRGQLVNNKLVDASLQVRAFVANNRVTIASMAYRALSVGKTGTNVYVPPRYGVRDFLLRPEGMLSPDFDIFYGGFLGGVTPLTSGNTVVVEPKVNAYLLTFTNNLGKRYTIYLTEINGTTLVYGRSDRRLKFVEDAGFFIAKNENFVVTSASDINGVTNVLYYAAIDRTRGVLTFTDLAGGNHFANFDPNTGVGTLIVAGYSYTVNVDTATDNIRVDLNRDGTMNSGTANIVLSGGQRLSFTGAITGTLTTPARLTRDGTTDETIQFTISILNSRVTLSVASPQGTFQLFSKPDATLHGVSQFGTYVFVSADFYPQLIFGLPISGSGIGLSGQAQAFVVATLERSRLLRAK